MFDVDSARVRALLFQRGVTLREFAAQAGINPLTAAKLVRDGATASMKVISTLANFFGVDGNTLILRKTA